MDLAVFLKAVPELVQTKGSILPGKSSASPSLLDLSHCLSLLLSQHLVRRSQKMALWLLFNDWRVIVDDSLQGQDAVVRPLLLKSLFDDTFHVLVLSGLDYCSMLYWDVSLKFPWQTLGLSLQPTFFFFFLYIICHSSIH